MSAFPESSPFHLKVRPEVNLFQFPPLSTHLLSPKAQVLFLFRPSLARLGSLNGIICTVFILARSLCVRCEIEQGKEESKRRAVNREQWRIAGRIENRGKKVVYVIEQQTLNMDI